MNPTNRTVTTIQFWDCEWPLTIPQGLLAQPVLMSKSPLFTIFQNLSSLSRKSHRKKKKKKQQHQRWRCRVPQSASASQRFARPPSAFGSRLGPLSRYEKSVLNSCWVNSSTDVNVNVDQLLSQQFNSSTFPNCKFLQRVLFGQFWKVARSLLYTVQDLRNLPRPHRPRDSTFQRILPSRLLHRQAPELLLGATGTWCFCIVFLAAVATVVFFKFKGLGLDAQKDSTFRPSGQTGCVYLYRLQTEKSPDFLLKNKGHKHRKSSMRPCANPQRQITVITWFAGFAVPW